MPTDPRPDPLADVYRHPGGAYHPGWQRETDHDPLAEALEATYGREAEDAQNVGIRPSRKAELEAWNYVAEHFAAYTRGLAPQEVRAALDAAGYEVRPKLTAERLAAAMLSTDPQPPGVPMVNYAAAILAALAAEASE